jgi:MATE family multidrug resistance protein
MSKSAYSGKLSEILNLFIPIALTTLSGSLTLFIERLFFAYLSNEAIEAAINAIYVYNIFQAPCLVIAMMAQVYVGRLHGAQENHAIGGMVWQFIWFALLSMVIVIPTGYLFATYYFSDTALEDLALPYFYLLLSINFLYPLGTGLSCFYIGRGKTRLCLLTSLGSYCINLLLAYILIFGVEGWIPALGLIGGAISNLIAQGLYCLFLLAVFLSPKYAKIYGTHNWMLQPKLFWDSIYPGILRALNRLSVLLCWACLARLMMTKQGDYLLFWSIGGIIGLFLPFIGEAIGQALTTVLSNMVGAGAFNLIRNADFAGFLLVMVIVAAMGIPMLLIPTETFHLLFPEVTIANDFVIQVFFGLWLTFTFATLCYIPVSRILAFKDTSFFLVTGALPWIDYYLVLYVAVNILEVSAALCWTILGFSNLVVLIIYLWRANWLISQKYLCNINP